jgi:hypothetical protein
MAAQLVAFWVVLSSTELVSYELYEQRSVSGKGYVLSHIYVTVFFETSPHTVDPIWLIIRLVSCVIHLAFYAKFSLQTIQGWKYEHLLLTFLYCSNIWGFYIGDYEECRILIHKNPVCTSQEIHYISATEPSRLMLCKIWGFHSIDNIELERPLVFWRSASSFVEIQLLVQTYSGRTNMTPWVCFSL